MQTDGRNKQFQIFFCFYPKILDVNTSNEVFYLSFCSVSCLKYSILYSKNDTLESIMIALRFIFLLKKYPLLTQKQCDLQ